MTEIVHKGKIIKIEKDKATVAVNRGEMCNHCLAKASCRLLSENIQLITATINSDDSFEIGEEVMISTAGQTGWKAIFWCYILPLVILLLAVLGGNIAKLSENKTAVISILAVLIYFLGLWKFSKKIEQKVIFEIEKI